MCLVSGDRGDVGGGFCSTELLVSGTGGSAAELGLAYGDLVAVLNKDNLGSWRGGAGKVDLGDAIVESCASLLSLPDWTCKVLASGEKLPHPVRPGKAEGRKSLSLLSPWRIGALGAMLMSVVMQSAALLGMTGGTGRLLGVTKLGMAEVAAASARFAALVNSGFVALTTSEGDSLFLAATILCRAKAVWICSSSRSTAKASMASVRPACIL